MYTAVTPGDVLAINIDNKLAFYARAEEIYPDVKDGWLKLRLLVLNPTMEDQDITWILEPTQIDGEEFTMGGTPIRIERLPAPMALHALDPDEVVEEAEEEDKPEGQVIAFPPKKGSE